MPKACFYILLVWQSLLPSPCFTQDLESEKRKTASIITESRSSDGYYSEYRFFDSNGKCVKTLRHDQFESKHPVFNLNLPKASKENSNADFFDDLMTFSTNDQKLIPKTDSANILKQLNALKEYGLNVKTPVKATTIVGNPVGQRPIISKPANKFLVKVETARILDAYAIETEEISNSLLDCSYISIYNFTGNIIKEVLIPNKSVSFASISDDGNYMICICDYSLVWDEGLSIKPEGVLIVDLRTNEMNYILIPETKNVVDAESILFADQYFQMTFGNPWSGDKCDRLFINPYTRTYYLKTYQRGYNKIKKPIEASSFKQFEGEKERIEDFNAFSF